MAVKVRAKRAGIPARSISTQLTTCNDTPLANNVINQHGAAEAGTSGTCIDSFYDRSKQIPRTFWQQRHGIAFEKLLTEFSDLSPAGHCERRGYYDH